VKNLAFVAVCGGILFGGARAGELPQATPKDVGLSAAKLERVKNLVQNAVDKNQTAGAIVLIARQGKVAYLQTFGRLNTGADKPMPQDAIFRIHSMTKPITTMAALLLYEEGKFKLDDPVSTYLPEFKGLRVHSGKGDETVDAKHEMTIRDLMRHTSGLTYGMPNGTAVDKMYMGKGIDGPDLGNYILDGTNHKC
jgi:CubicO group peptidase (beta-lactamase class C family)